MYRFKLEHPVYPLPTLNRIYKTYQYKKHYQTLKFDADCITNFIKLNSKILKNWWLEHLRCRTVFWFTLYIPHTKFYALRYRQYYRLSSVLHNRDVIFWQGSPLPSGRKNKNNNYAGLFSFCFADTPRRRMSSKTGTFIV